MHAGTSSTPTAASAGSSLRASSLGETGVAMPYGRVDSAPISIMSAPSATMRRACAIAASGSRKRPPSENESGVTLRTPITIGRPKPSNRASVSDVSVPDLSVPGASVPEASLAARGLLETDWLAKLMGWLCAGPGGGVKRYQPEQFPVLPWRRSAAGAQGG